MNGPRLSNGSDANETLTRRSNQDDKALTALFAGQMQFSLDLFKTVFNASQPGVQSKSTSENIFFSPMSIYSALLLAYFGANNRTEDQLSHVLGFKEMDKVIIARDFFSLMQTHHRLMFWFHQAFTVCFHTFFIISTTQYEWRNFPEKAISREAGNHFPLRLRLSCWF